MKKTITAASLALAFTASMTMPAIAADLSNGNGQSCAEGQTGVWHFVNNQTGGAAPGTIVVLFDNAVIVQGATAVNRNNQHFTFEHLGGTLVDASTNLPGRLVLSDFTCEGDPKDPKDPPPKK